MNTQKSTSETIKTGVTVRGDGITGGSEAPDNSISKIETKNNNRDIGNGHTGSKAMSAESQAVVDKLKNAIPQLSGMAPVASITGKELKTGESRVTDRAYNFIARLGFKVNRPGLGDVLFSRSNIKNGFIGHGYGAEKEAAFAAVPDVIRAGKEIDYQQNWKGKGYDTHLYAAPANIASKPRYIGVVVAQDNVSNRYYVHEVVDEQGNIIYTETPPEPSDGRPAETAGIDTVTPNEVSINSISQPDEKSNGENIDNGPRNLSVGPVASSAQASGVRPLPGGKYIINDSVNLLGALQGPYLGRPIYYITENAKKQIKML